MFSSAPRPRQRAFVVAADCVGGFVEHDSHFLCLFIPLISRGAAEKGRGSLRLPSDGWVTGVGRCARQRAHLPSCHLEAWHQVLDFVVCLYLQLQDIIITVKGGLLFKKREITVTCNLIGNLECSSSLQRV